MCVHYKWEMTDKNDNVNDSAWQGYIHLPNKK